MFVTGGNLAVPFGTIVLRKGYGLGAQAMAGGSFKAPLFCISWPTAARFHPEALDTLKGEARTPDFLAIYETGVRYHLVHGLAVFVAAWLAGEDETRSARLAGVLFMVGILLFSGSLYLLALTGIRGFGAITPLGGVAWIAAWVIVALRVKLR